MQLLQLYVGPLLGASSPERATRNTTIAATRSKLLVCAQLEILNSAEQVTAAAALHTHTCQLLSGSVQQSELVWIEKLGLQQAHTVWRQTISWPSVIVFSVQISGSGLVPPRVGVQTAALLALRSAAEAAELPLMSCNITSWQLASSADARR